MEKRAFRLAYDGEGYHGFQRQPTVSTVEGELFAALERLGVFDGDHRPTGYAAAGRTDRGVSAIAQTVAFECPAWLTPRALNSELPADVRAWAMAETPSSFHATHDADSRTYTYFLLDDAVDESRLADALSGLAGTHDYSALTPDEDNTTRTLQTSLSVDGPFFVVRITAGGFARQLVRRVVGLASAIGRGERDDLQAVLSASELDGPDGVSPAAPVGLVLTDVAYPACPFERDPAAVAAGTAVFERRYRRLASRARVSRTIQGTLSPRNSTEHEQ